MRLLLTLLFIGTGSANSQVTFNCDTFFKKEILINDLEIFVTEVRNLEQCGADSIDIQLCLESSMMATFLVEHADKKPTYRDFLNAIIEFRKQPEYIQMRESLTEMNKIKVKKVNLAEWNTDKISFQKIGFENDEIDNFHDFLVWNKDKNWTYSESASEYLVMKDSIEKVNQEVEWQRLKKLYSKYCKESSLIDILHNTHFDILHNTHSTSVYQVIAFTDYEAGIKCAAKMNKAVLIYFNGYGAVNCRRMEDKVLADSKVNEYLRNNFVIINLYVDDKTLLPENMQSISSDTTRQITTVGQKNSEFQLVNFRMNSQPYMVILDKHNKLIDGMGYTGEPKTFMSFLTDGITKWKTE